MDVLAQYSLATSPERTLSTRIYTSQKSKPIKTDRVLSDFVNVHGCSIRYAFTFVVNQNVERDIETNKMCASQFYSI